MGRRLLFVILFAAVLLAPTVPSWASLCVDTVSTVKATSESGKVVLKIQVYNVEGTKGVCGDDKVTVQRADQNYWGPIDQNVVAVLKPTRKGNETLTFTDTTVETGETYYYRASSGLALGTRNASTSVTVRETPQNATGGTEDLEERRLAYENQADWPERLASSIIMAVPNWFVKVIGLYDPVELVFQTSLENGPEDPSHPSEAKFWHTFTGSELAALGVYYDSLMEFVPIELVVVLIILGLGLLWSSTNPESKLGFKEYLVGFVLGVLLLRLGADLLGFLFDVNYAIVKEFQYICGAYLKDSFLESLYNEETASLGSAIVALIAVFSIGLLNFQYTMRKIIIALLIGVLPIVAIISIPPSNRRALAIWFRELVANIFLQSAHAAALALLLLINAGLCGPQGFWVKITAALGLASMAGLVRRVFGAESLGSGMAAGVGAALGLGALFAMGRMLGVGRGGLAGTGGTGGMLSGMTGAVAKGALGLGGAVAGGILSGAATGNPGFGATIGAMTGASVGGAVADAGVSLGSHLATDPDKRSLWGQGGFYDPEAARQAGTRLLGNNMLGRTAGGALGMTSRVAGAIDPDKARAAAVSRGEFNSLRQGFETAQGALGHEKLNLDEAKAQHDYLKAMYTPDSAHMQELAGIAGIPGGNPLDADAVSKRMGELGAQRAGLEQAMAEIYNDGDPEGADKERLEGIQGEIAKINRQEMITSSVFADANRGQDALQSSKTALEMQSADYASQKVEAVNLDKRMRDHALYEEIAKLQTPRSPKERQDPYRWR